MKVFDCFLFFNEIELLELRLATLNDVVDHFVLVESTSNFAGTPKDLIFDRSKELFEKYLHKIIHIKVIDTPPDLPFGGIEAWQRNCIERGLVDAAAGDRVMIGDVDEIPDPRRFPKALSYYSPRVFILNLFYYHVNCLQEQLWPGTVILSREMFPIWGNNWESIRMLRNAAVPIGEGGWHYSHLGDAKRNRIRLNSVVEHLITFDAFEISDEELQHRIDTQQDLYRRPYAYARKRLVDIFGYELSPPGIREWLQKYPQFYFGELP